MYVDMCAREVVLTCFIVWENRLLYISDLCSGRGISRLIPDISRLTPLLVDYTQTPSRLVQLPGYIDSLFYLC